jgi:hypothetical protein
MIDNLKQENNKKEIPKIARAIIKEQVKLYSEFPEIKRPTEIFEYYTQYAKEHN